MEYNTTRNKLLLPEYGRNVQNMIAHAMEIESKEERNKAAQAIIEVMGQLNPHLRDVDDYRHKLWTHLFVMSDFKLDVDSPYVIPKQESLHERPAIMEYPKSKIKYGHYGQYTQRILENASELTDKAERDYLTLTMANFMKKQFLVHNNDAVENTVIGNQMKELSKGTLILENPDELISTNVVLREMGVSVNPNKRAKTKTNNNPSNANNNPGAKKRKFKY